MLAYFCHYYYSTCNVILTNALFLIKRTFSIQKSFSMSNKVLLSLVTIGID